VIKEKFPIEYVIKRYGDGGLETINILIEIGHDPSINDNNAIIMASDRKATRTIKLLLNDCRVDPSVNHNAIIKSSARFFCDTELMKLLLEHPKVDPTANNNDPLFGAVSINTPEVAELLIKDPRVDPTINSNYLIKYTVNNGIIDMVRLLLKDPRVNPNVTNGDTIQTAIKNRKIDIVRLLLEDRRMGPYIGNNTIQIAIENCDIEMVKLLLADRRADPAINNNLAIRTAADKSVKCRTYNKIIELLINDPRVDASVSSNYVIKQIMNVPDNEIIFGLLMSTTKITIDRELLSKATYYCSKDYILNYIADSVYGMIAMHETYRIRRAYIGLLSCGETGINKNISNIYNNFLKSIILKQANITNISKFLTSLIINLDPEFVSIIQGNEIPCIKDHKINDYVFAFRGFMILHKTNHTYRKIIEILTKEGASKFAIYLSAKLIGAQIGLDNLLENGLCISSQSKKNIKDVLSWQFIKTLV
jgi:hypothetical protein